MCNLQTIISIILHQLSHNGLVEKTLRADDADSIMNKAQTLGQSKI